MRTPDFIRSDATRGGLITLLLGVFLVVTNTDADPATSMTDFVFAMIGLFAIVSGALLLARPKLPARYRLDTPRAERINGIISSLALVLAGLAMFVWRDNNPADETGTAAVMGILLLVMGLIFLLSSIFGRDRRR